jgi:hypothetical protein
MLIHGAESGRSADSVKSIPVWREVLTEELTLNLVIIPGGRILHGITSTEEGRDVYKDSFPELEGVDVEKQHGVTIKPFL